MALELCRDFVRGSFEGARESLPFFNQNNMKLSDIVCTWNHSEI